MTEKNDRRQHARWPRNIASGAAAALLVAAMGLTTAGAAMVGQPLTTPNQVMQMAGAPKAYVGLFKDNAVAVIDTDSKQVLKTIPIPAGPHGLVVTPDGAKVFVSSDGDSVVSVIDTASDQVVDTVQVGQTPHGLAISPDGKDVLVSGFGANQAELLDTSTDQIVGRVDVAQPHNSAISPDGKRAYVGSQLQGSTALVALDLTTMARTAIIPLDKTPRALSYSPDGRWVYFTLAGSDAVQVLDTSRNEVTGQIPVGASPHLPLFTPDGALAMAVAQGPGELDLIDPASNSQSAAIKVGMAPHWIATSADGKLAYVTNENSNDLSIVDLSSHQVISTLPVGNGPRKVAVQPGAAMAMSGGMAMDAQPVPATAGTRQSSGVTYNDHGTADVRGKEEFDVEADDNYFEPTFLRGDPGQTIKLDVENEGNSNHNFSIASLGINTNIPPHSSAEIQVTFPQSGATRFFCSFHTATGMNGGLLVGDATP
jgi:YVTN family beta-propeller protein